MTPRRSVLAAKEARALAPLWAAATAAVLAAAAAGYPALAVLLVFPASAALGAQSFGHEFGARTLPFLLAQPVPRGRLLAVKLGVLASLLAALGAATIAGPGRGVVHLSRGLEVPLPLVVAAALAGGLLLAPWLTLVCRNALAATVFTMAVPGTLWVAGEFVGVARFGLLAAAAGDVARIRLAFAGWTLLGAWLLAAALLWRAVSRLEVLDGAPAMAWPGAGARRAPPRARARPRHALVALAAKELRLHDMAFIVSTLFAALWLAIDGLRLLPPFVGPSLEALAFVHGGIIALLIGAVASAEERQLGTHEAQLLAPASARLQWTVKAGVALGLTLVLGVGVPGLLDAVTAPADRFQVRPEYAATLLVLTTAALYVSSLSTSGIRALIVALPVIAGAIWVSGLVLQPVGRLAYREVYAAWTGLIEGGYVAFSLRPPLWTFRWLPPAFAAGLITALLSFALAHHRSADRRIGRAVRHAGWLAAGAFLATVLLAGLQAVHFASFRAEHDATAGASTPRPPG